MSLFNFYENNQEWDLYDGFTKEFVDQFGIPIKFLKRTEVNEDHLWGEDTISSYDSAIDLKMYLSTPEAYNGPGDIFQKFGMQIDDSLEFFINKSDIETKLGEIPEISDLIYIPFIERLFELNYVKDDDFFYPFGKKLVYMIKIKNFEYSAEDIQTGEDEVDLLHNNFDDTTGEEETQRDTEINEIVDFSENDPFKSF